jgi:putative tricarboxylic transport membrane protein
MEENLRRSFRISQGDPMVLLERPLSAALLVIAALLLLMVILPAVRRRREEVFTEPG